MNRQSVTMNGTEIVQEGKDIYINGRHVDSQQLHPALKFNQMIGIGGIGFVIGMMCGILISL